MSTPLKPEELYAHSIRLNRTLQIAFDAFNSKDLQVTLQIAGHRKDGSPLLETLRLSATDPELVNFFELYASNLYAKKLILDKQLQDHGIPPNQPPKEIQQIGKLKVESEG